MLINRSGLNWEEQKGWAVVGDEPMLFIGMDEIRAEAARQARPWTGLATYAEGPYYQVLKAYRDRDQDLTLPVIGARIPWRVAGWAFLLTSFYLSIVFAHAMLRLRAHGVDTNESWLLVEPCCARGRLETWLFRRRSDASGRTRRPKRFRSTDRQPTMHRVRNLS